jgi:hypothetical protein
VAPISPSSAISSRHAWEAGSMCFESDRVIDGHFCGERGVPSKYHEAYFSIRISTRPNTSGRKAWHAKQF